MSEKNVTKGFISGGETAAEDVEKISMTIRKGVATTENLAARYCKFLDDTEAKHGGISRHIASIREGIRRVDDGGCTSVAGLFTLMFMAIFGDQEKNLPKIVKFLTDIPEVADGMMVLSMSEGQTEETIEIPDVLEDLDRIKGHPLPADIRERIIAVMEAKGREVPDWLRDDSTDGVASQASAKVTPNILANLNPDGQGFVH
jgi:hypothetical protein